VDVNPESLLTLTIADDKLSAEVAIAPSPDPGAVTEQLILARLAADKIAETTIDNDAVRALVERYHAEPTTSHDAVVALGRAPVHGEDGRIDVDASCQMLNDIVEHLAEEPGRRMIEEVFRVLRPGGRLVVDTDNDAFIMQRKGLRRLNDWLERDTPQRRALAEIKKSYTAPTLHIKIYTVDELRRLLESVGFRIDAFDTYAYIAVPGRDAFFNLPGLRHLFRNVKGDVQIFRAVKPA